MKSENEKKTFQKWSVFHSHLDRRKNWEDRFYKNPKYNYSNYAPITNGWRDQVLATFT